MGPLLRGSQRRFPARIRIFAALAFAVCVHGAFSSHLESARVSILAGLPGAGAPGGLLATGDRAIDDSELRQRVAAWREGRIRLLMTERRAAVPVLFFRPKDRIAIIGAGKESGLEVLDPVEVPAGLLGFIEAVDRHVSRVRLLSGAKSRIPVTLADTRPGLPGEIPGLNAVLEGTGDGGHLVAGSLLAEFKEGDRLTTVEAKATARPLAVGVVTAAGPDPKVRLFAGPGDLGLVTVALDRVPSEPLFAEVLLRVRAAPFIASAGALLAGPGVDRVAAGCAVHSRGRYLGRVVMASGRGAVASRLVDAGHRLFVRTLGAGNRTSTGELVSLGGDRFELRGHATDPEDRTLLAVTAGGQDLIPADLGVGFLERDGDRWLVRDAAVDWPREAMVSVFTFDEELEGLLKR